jgi:hydroxypyruvate isomerase
MADDSMTTDKAIAEIDAILKRHVPGDYASGERMAAFLQKAAEELRDEMADDMSLRDS